MAASNHCFLDGKIYKHASSLTYHNQVHQKEKFTCEVCFKSFRSKKTLSFHKKKHNPNLVGLDCNICTEKFDHKENLRRHMRTVHEEKQYYCILCNNSYARKDKLKEHYSKSSDIMKKAAANKEMEDQKSMEEEFIVMVEDRLKVFTTSCLF